MHPLPVRTWLVTALIFYSEYSAYTLLYLYVRPLSCVWDHRIENTLWIQPELMKYGWDGGSKNLPPA